MSDELSMGELKKIMANPFYAINIDPNLAALHPPLITRDEWIQVAIRNITEDDEGNHYGFDEKLVESLTDWLNRLLDVLEGDYA